MKNKKPIKKSTVKVTKTASAKKQTAPKENPVVASLKKEIESLKFCIEGYRDTKKKLLKRVKDLKDKLEVAKAKASVPVIATVPANEVNPITTSSPFIKSDPFITPPSASKTSPVLVPDPNRVFSHNLDAVAKDPIVGSSDNWVAVPFPCM